VDGRSGRPLLHALEVPTNRGTPAAELRAAIVELQPQALVMTAPGDSLAFGNTGESLDMIPDQARQGRLLRPPSLVMDRLRWHSSQLGFAIQSNPDGNARTSIAGHRHFYWRKKRTQVTDTLGKRVAEELFILANADR